MTPEGAVLKAVLDYLAARHVLAFRMNTGAVASEYKGKKRFMRFGTPGMADVLAFHGSIRTHFISVPLWIECKAPNGKQSELQASFQKMVESEGHKYILTSSIEDLEEVLGRA